MNTLLLIVPFYGFFFPLIMLLRSFTKFDGNTFVFEFSSNAFLKSAIANSILLSALYKKPL